MSKERQSFLERAGARVRNAGIVAGLIGLVLSENVMVLGALAALGGELLRRGASINA